MANILSAKQSSDLRFGVIGYGYWGPNVVRNLFFVDGANVSVVCDKNYAALSKVKRQYPTINIVRSWQDVVTSPEIDAVAIVTPVSTHFELAKAALENGKHIFVEKPFTASVAEAEQLIELAQRKRLTVMVDHTFLFTGAVQKIKQLVSDRLLGKIYYYDSTRVNLGIVQGDVNVVWDLAPHDFAILRYLIPEKPAGVIACGQKHIGQRETIAYILVYFQSSLIAHFNVNWLSPVKVRSTFIGGTRKMLVWNDVLADDKIKIYDKGVDIKHRHEIYNLMVSYRSGDMSAPKVNSQEALAQECRHFVECIRTGAAPLNDGIAGLEVVRMLTACDQSMKKQGRLIRMP
jgi:predicted dehydrogenase